MRRKWIVILIGILLCVSTFFLEFNLCKLTYNKNKKESEEILRIAYALIEKNDSNNTNETFYSKFAEKINNDIKEIENNIVIENPTNIENAENKEKNVGGNNAENNIINDKNIIGVLVIPALQVEAPIKEGTTQEVMRTAVGHFTESDYWTGNVSFASHNGGTGAHYFRKIYTLKANDEIEYITKLGTKKYKVQSVEQIKSTDWSKVVKVNNQSENIENTITLITCINWKPNYRLCVRGIEI